MIAFKLIIVEDITRGIEGEDIKMFSLCPPAPPTLIAGAVFSAGSLFSLRLQFPCWITALYSARDYGVFPVYLFSVPELNAGCFFVLMPSAKEFRRWGMERGKEEEGWECQESFLYPPEECVLTSLTLLHSMFSSLLPLFLIGSRPWRKSLC